MYPKEADISHKALNIEESKDNEFGFLKDDDFKEIFIQAANWALENYDPWYYLENDELPKEESKILCFIQGKYFNYYKLALYANGIFRYSKNGHAITDKVIAYMPIPEPKKR